MTVDIEDAVHHIDTRVTLLESEFHTFADSYIDSKRWIRGIAVFLVLQIVLAAMAFASLSKQVDLLDVDDMRANDTTALSVLAAHGDEIEAVRNETARLRGVLDSIRTEINIKTANRFTSQDGARHAARITRLESVHWERLKSGQ